MKVYYDKDCDLSLIKGKTVAIIGYGSQGHAHAQNLNDSGVKVIVGLRKGGASWPKVEKAGLKVAEVADAVKAADVVMILLPDEQIATVYKNDVEPNIKQGASLAFAHGFNVHYGQVVPRADLDVWMVAPKAPGHTVRAPTPRAAACPTWWRCMRTSPAAPATWPCRTRWPTAAARPASSRPTSAKRPRPTCSASRPCCGGTVELIKAGYETLVEAGYAPEMAYFECLHELKLIVDLIYEGGIANMNYSISNNAEYGERDGPAHHHRGDQEGDEAGPEGHPDRRVRQELHHREPRRRADPAVAPPPERRELDRGGGRAAAGDDALDQEEQAGRPDPQLRDGKQGGLAP